MLVGDSMVDAGDCAVLPDLAPWAVQMSTDIVREIF